MQEPAVHGATRSGKRASPSGRLRASLLSPRNIWIALGLLLLPAAVIAVEVKPDARTVVVAILFVLGIVGSVWMMRDSDYPGATPADPADVDGIRAQLNSTRADLRKADAWMRFFPLGILMAALLKFSALTDFEMSSFFPKLFELARGGDTTLGAFVILGLVLLYYARRSMFLQRELRRLEAIEAARKTGPGYPLPPVL